MYRQITSTTIRQKEEITTLHSFQSIDDHLYFPVRKYSRQSSTNLAIQRIQSIIKKKMFQKQCYSLQMLKQFLLFPQSSVTSSCISVSKYDPLIFSDQHLHSVLKILETQLQSRRIWAFINLKMHRKLSLIREGSIKLQQAYIRKQSIQKQEAIQLIKAPIRIKKVHFAQEQPIDIKISPKVNMSEKMTKLQVSTSKRTAAESDRDYHYEARHQFIHQHSSTSHQFNCTNCCMSCCCCCNQQDSLWQKIQYMKYLQNLANHRERNPTYY